MMVAEIVGRGQSGSPVNGELPLLNSSMPSSHGRDALLASPSPNGDAYQQTYGIGSHLKQKEILPQRKQREFTPENKKDDSYWDRRRRNNEAAKRSREKRRFNDMVLEQRVLELTNENAILKAQLETIREEFGICGEKIVCPEKVLASLPNKDQVLTYTKRQKLTHPAFFSSPSPIPTPVIHQPVLTSPPPQPISLPQVHPTIHHEPPYRELEYHPQFSSFPPYHHPQSHSPTPYDSGNNALNLSRSRSRGRQSPYEVSSNSGDESTPLALTTSELNNSLPLKLRHKVHLGDKDAASALLSLQNIKQEPGPRSSPPWDAEGSSDERDSGISLGGEWTTATAAAATLQTLQKQSQLSLREHTASELERISSEVAILKSIINKDQKEMVSNQQ
ncbi:uncharacterized protein [Onthophagus taurus]|nr:uncharacterized protein LOC111425210 isoform X2 [Onthophagus taurus]